MAKPSFEGAFSPPRVVISLRAVGTLLTLTVSRYREYTANRGSAIVTGPLAKHPARPAELARQLGELDS